MSSRFQCRGCKVDGQAFVQKRRANRMMRGHFGASKLLEVYSVFQRFLMMQSLCMQRAIERISEPGQLERLAKTLQEEPEPWPDE